MWVDSLTFSIDWVNVTVDCPDLLKFVTEISEACDLDLEGFTPLARGGFHWYANSLSYAPSGYSAITLSYMLLDDGTVPIDCSVVKQHGIMVSISGDGCRYLDSHTENGLRKFLNVCRQYPHNCTRLDVAMDIFDKDNPIVPLFADFAKEAYNPEPGHVAIKGNMVRKEGYVRWMPVWDTDFKEFTSNVYIGDRTSSKGHCCVYNKKVEVRNGRLANMAQQIFDSVGCTDYWYRCEYRAKNRVLANTSFEAACDGSPSDVFFYMADHLFTFVDQIYSLQNISKCDVNEVWSDFMAWLENNAPNVHFVELTAVPYVEASVPRLVTWMKRNAAFVYNISLMQQRFPEFFSGLLDVGELKRQSSGRYVQFDEQFSHFNQDDLSRLVV